MWKARRLILASSGQDDTAAPTQTATEAPRRSPLDLLELDYAFSQRQLLTVDEFIKEAEKRGVRLEVGHLEALHRSGHLVPMFRIEQGRRAIVKAWEPNGYMVPQASRDVESLREYRTKKR